MRVTSIGAIKEQWNLPDFFNPSPICPHNFPFHTLLLHFLFDMSHNSSHLGTDSIFILFWRQTWSTHCKQTFEAQWRWGNYCSHYENRPDSDRFGLVPSRQTFSLADVTETFLSVWGFGSALRVNCISLKNLATGYDCLYINIQYQSIGSTALQKTTAWQCVSCATENVAAASV